MEEEQGVTIGLSFEEQIRQAQIKAGEDVVIANLHKHFYGNNSSEQSIGCQIRQAQIEAGEKIICDNLPSKRLSKIHLEIVK